MIAARERRILSLALLAIGALGIAAAWPLATKAVLHGSAVAISSVRYLAALGALGLVLLLFEDDCLPLDFSRAARRCPSWQWA